LPAHQDKDLTIYCFENLRDEINIFKIDEDFTAELVKHLMYLEVDKGQFIYREGDFPEEIYFMAQGKVDLIDPEGFNMLSMVEGCFFGEIEAID
jgi:CRP/FNR family transcriptional regulator, putaive post-exponential-phase nitrogen-starvation regulator